MQNYPQYLVLVRHGQSEANAQIAAESNDLYYALSGSDREIGLTPLGAAQSRNAGKQLSRLFPACLPIRRVWLSPFRRIRETVDQIELALGYKPARIEDERLAKRSYGLLWNLTYKGVELLYPEEHAKFKQAGHLAYRPPDGENYYDLFLRVEDFIRQEIEQSEGNLLVAAHSVVILSFQRYLDGLSDQEVVQRYESVALPNGQFYVYVRLEAGMPWQPLASPEELVA